LVTNGDFATDSDWSKGNKWTISGGTANKATDSTSNISQVISGISGKRIQVTFTISNQSGSGGVGASANGSDYTQNSANGTYTEYITPTSDNFYIRASYSFVCSIDNVSVKEVFENDVPRLDYSGGATCASLLLEGQRTNLITYSEDFSEWISSSNVTITDNVAISPQGLQNAGLINFTSGSNYFQNNGSAIVSGNTYTISCYVKRALSTNQVFLLYGNNNKASANLTATSEWQRFTHTFIADSTNFASGMLTLSACQIYIYGFQVEEGSYPTSYIPTSGSTVTRTADSGILTSASALIGQTEGTLYSEFDLTEDNNFTFVEINLGNSTSNRILAYRNASYIQFIVQVGGVIEINNSTLVTFLDTNKIAVTYQTDDFKIYLNGSLVKTYTSGSIPSGFDTIDLQDNNLAGKKQSIKSLILFKEILTNAELITLTTI